MSKSDTDDLIVGILETAFAFAVVGASAKEDRPSYQVMKFLMDKGYRVLPVNPGLAGQEILGRTVYASLSEIDGSFDVVDIFRKSEDVPGIVDEAIRIAADKGIQVIWMQLGVQNEKAKQAAEAAGLVVIQNHCPKIEYGRLMDN